MAKKQDTISIGFEEKIWKAADILRGNLSASQYEGVVLGLIFLKYISDRFEQKFQELQGDEYADPEDKDEYTAENIFFVPAEARWSKISAAAHTPEIGVIIDEALTAIERENERLKGILPKNFARPELDKRRLGDVVDLFTNIEMHDAGEEKDLLGRTYEYCLQQFASLEGKNGGEFYTPSCIVRTLVEILEPYEGRVYDPCCGSGGMFVQSAKFIERHKGNLRKISIYGQEANPDTWKMAHMNLAIRGLDANLGNIFADTFYDDQHPTLKADYILANPPFNLSDWGQNALAVWFATRWQRQLCVDAAHDSPSGTKRKDRFGSGEWCAFESEWRRGTDSPSHHRSRPGRGNRGFAFAAVLQYGHSCKSLVYQPQQGAEGQDRVYRCPQSGHDGYS